MLRKKLLMWLTGFLPARAIDIDNKYYIERYHVCRIGKLTVMIHRYLGSDGDRHVHDHPWKLSVGIPLIGGYEEERVMGFCPENGWISKLVKIRPWRWNFISAMRFHRIAHVAPGTWTLFITYNRFKSWSFAYKKFKWVSSIGFHRIDGVVLRQPYDTASVAGWQKNAPKGKEFRVTRGTNN